MNTAAPSNVSRLPSNVSRLPSPYEIPLSAILPGELFLFIDTPHTLFAPLSHDKLDVVDATRRWCVAVAYQGNGEEATQPGTLVSFLMTSAVVRIHVLTLMQLMPVAAELQAH